MAYKLRDEFAGIHLTPLVLMIILLFFSLQVPVSGEQAQGEGEIKPKQFQEVEGYLFPGLYDEYGWPERLIPFYLREGQEVGITIMWSPLAVMRVGIVIPGMNENEWAVSTAPIWGSEVRVSAPADGLYYVRIKNEDSTLGAQYSGYFIIYP